MTQLGPPGPSSGPNGSVPFGQGGALDQLHQRLQQGPQTQGARILPPQMRPQGGAPQGPPRPGTGPVQPPPQAPPGPRSPQGPPQLYNQQPTPEPWRRNLQTWAMHPDANPETRAMGVLSALDQAPPEVAQRFSRGGA